MWPPRGEIVSLRGQWPAPRHSVAEEVGLWAYLIALFAAWGVVMDQLFYVVR